MGSGRGCPVCGGSESLKTSVVKAQGWCGLAVVHCDD